MASQLCESVCLHGPEPLVSWYMPETGQGLLSAWWGLFVYLFCFGPVLNNFSLSPSVIQNVNTLTDHWAEHNDRPVGVDCFFFPLKFTSFTLCKYKVAYCETSK